jgi:peptidoglycan glycosyltransferase
VKTGAVLAMFSNPTFDPQPLASHDTAAANAASALLNLDPAKPSLPRSYRERYPPGSTFKVVTAAGAIDTGVAAPDRIYPFASGFVPPGTTTAIGNFGGGGCGGGDLLDSFIASCNVTFARLGAEMGDQFVPVMNGCGVGTDSAPIAPELDLEPGAAGSVGPPVGAGEPRFALAGIGQGDVFTTPLEMALLAAGIANRGMIMRPHVAQEITDTDGKVIQRIDPQQWLQCMPDSTAATLTDLMVANVEGGTGTAAQIDNVAVAGKTGTAQTGIEGQSPHAWFIAFAPADNPQYAVSVLVENGGDYGSDATGGEVAAPIAREILLSLLNP